MTAFSADIALIDDIVAELNRRPWFMPFVAERTWLPEWSQQVGDLKTLQVSVNPWIVPQGELTERPEDIDEDEEQPSPQSGMWTVWPIDVTFAQKITAQTLEELDRLADTTEQVRQFLCPQCFRLGDGRTFESMAFEYLARFDPSQFTRSVVKGQQRYTGVYLAAFRIPFRLLGE